MDKKTEILTEFNLSFPSEESCLEYLCRLRWPEGFVCPRCGWRKAWQIQPYKFKCQRPGCAYQVTPTAETIFHRSHLPLRKWFVAMWYTSTLGSESITVEQLQEMVGLGSIHTALRLRHVMGSYTPVHLCQLKNDAAKLRLQDTVAITGCSLPYKGAKIPIILAQEEKTEPVRFYAHQSPNFSSRSLVNFLDAFVASRSKLVIDYDFFNPMAVREQLNICRRSFTSCSFWTDLSVGLTAEKLKKEWSRQIAEKEKSPLDEFLKNYPSRQSDPKDYQFNFERFMERCINGKKKTI